MFELNRNAQGDERLHKPRIGLFDREQPEGELLFTISDARRFQYPNNGVMRVSHVNIERRWRSPTDLLGDRFSGRRSSRIMDRESAELQTSELHRRGSSLFVAKDIAIPVLHDYVPQTTAYTCTG